ATVTHGWPKDPAVLKDVKAIVLHTRMGGNVLFDPIVRDRVEKLLQSGVGLTAIHWSTGADAGTGPMWLETLGGWFNAEPKVGFSKYGILWTAHVDVPAEGAPVQIGKKDLDLPPPVVGPRKGTSETIKLFNGKDLDGWEGYKDLWSVKDGAIVGKNTTPLKYSTYLLTKQKFTDFRLIFQTKLAESEMHSGVALWGEI